MSNIHSFFGHPDDSLDVESTTDPDLNVFLNINKTLEQTTLGNVMLYVFFTQFQASFSKFVYLLFVVYTLHTLLNVRNQNNLLW